MSWGQQKLALNLSSKDNLMKIIFLILTLSLVSCGKNSSSSCSPSKKLMSTWTSRETGNVFMMSNCTIGSVCEVKFGSGACDDDRGDFLILVQANGTAIMGNCEGDTVLDRATYKVSCDNLLSITYESSGETEVFD
jgi:hypothetical protein